MTLLDVSGSGLFSNSSAFMHVLGEIVKLAAGSFLILVLAFFSFMGIIVYSVYSGYKSMSVLHGARTLIHGAAYAIGISIALVFALVAGMFFSIAVGKLFLVTALIAFILAFVVRETFLFMVLKRFGKYLMYFTALQYIKEKVYNHGQQEDDYQTRR